MGRGDRGALVLAALAGMSGWISLGILAVTDHAGARIGALPPFWSAGLLTAAAIACAWLMRLKTSEAWPLALTVVLWIPWMPFAIPAAFLMWEGPLEIVIWAAAIGGLIAAQFLQTFRPSIVTDPRRAPWIAAVVVFVCSLASWQALGDRVPDGDEPQYLIITQSLLADGDLQIENNHRQGDYLQYRVESMAPDFLRRGVNDQIYSIHAPGLPALILPAFAVAGYPGTVVLVALVAAIGVALSWRVAFAVTKHAGSAWAATFALGFSAPYFLHSFTIFPDPVGAVILAATTLFVVRLETAAHDVRRWQISAVGIALAMLPWLHTRFAVIASAAAVCIATRLVRRADRWPSLAAFAAVPALSALLWFSYFWILYGAPDPTAPYGNSRQNAFQWMPNGATGLLFDQQFGLLPNAPVMAFAMFGLLALARSSRWLTFDIVAMGLPYAAVVMSFGMWWGGWSAPARFLVAVLPLAVPVLAMAWLHGGPAARNVFVALTAIGLGNVAARVLILDGALLYNLRDGSDLLLDWLSQTINLPLAFPAIHRTGARVAVMIAAVWALMGTIMLALLTTVFRHRVRSLGARWAVSTGAMIGAAVVATTVSWRVVQAPALTPESSKVAFVGRWRPALTSIGIEMAAGRLLPAQTAIRRVSLGSSDRTRTAAAERPLIEIPRMPAGVYRLVTEGEPQLAGLLTMTVGLDEAVVDQWSLDGVSGGETPILIELPIAVRLLLLRGDARAVARLTSVALRPERVAPVPPMSGEIAVRAARYGRVRAFVLDERTYVEPRGLWTRGDTTAKLLLIGDDDSVASDFQTGPRQVTVELRMDSRSDRLELAPGERRRVRLPTRTVVSIRTIGVFRPVDHDPASGDARPLGVRIEFP